MSKEITSDTFEGFEATRDFQLESKSIIDWSMYIPTTGQEGSAGYFETSKKEGAKRSSTRLTKEGKMLVDTNWQVLLLSENLNPETISPADLTLDDIKDKAETLFVTLSGDANYSHEFLGLMKRSFEGRIRYLENQKFWAEMDATNSPWNEAVETISATLYPDLRPEFVKNFATHSIIQLKQEIQENVGNYVQTGVLSEEDLGFTATAYETRIANHITRHLINSDQNGRNSLRAGGMNTLVGTVLNERRFTSHDEDHAPVVGYMNKTLESVLNEKANIALVRSEDISLESMQSQTLPEPTTRERITHKVTQIRQYLDNHLPRIADKRKALAAVIGILGVSFIARGAGEKISGWEIYREWVNEKNSISQQVSADMAKALQDTRDGIDAMSMALEQKISHIAAIRFSPDLAMALGVKDGVTDQTDTSEITPPAATVVPTEDKKPIVTATQTAANMPTVTPESAATALPTSTPTEVPHVPLVFDQIDFSTGDPVELQANMPDGTALDLSFTPKRYEDNSTSTETGALFSEMKKSSIAIVDADKYGNTLLYVDSGYQGTEPLDAEDWRLHLEGGSIDGGVPLANDEQRQINLESLVGTTIPVKQGDVTEQFVITAAGYVPHDSVQDFGQDTKTALNVLVDVTGRENSPFAVYQDGDRHALLYVFCGWGPRSEDRWWVYSRYVVALEPVKNVPAQDQATENASLSINIQAPSQENAPAQEIEMSPYVSEIQTVTGVINNYAEAYPYDGVGEKPQTTLGEFIKSSDWYAQKSPEEKARMEDMLRLIDSRTYSYWDSQSGYQAIQCLYYEGLLYSLGYPEGPKHNLVGSGLDVVYPGDVIGNIGEYKNFIAYATGSVNLNTLSPGSLLITPTHVLVVIENENGTVWLTDANRNLDGRADIFSITDTQTLEDTIGPLVYLE